MSATRCQSSRASGVRGAGRAGAVAAAAADVVWAGRPADEQPSADTATRAGVMHRESVRNMIASPERVGGIMHREAIWLVRPSCGRCTGTVRSDVLARVIARDERLVVPSWRGPVLEWYTCIVETRFQLPTGAVWPHLLRPGLAVVCVLGGSCSPPSPARTSERGLPDQRAYAAIIEGAIRAGVPGIQAHVERGSERWSAAAGLA